MESYRDVFNRFVKNYRTESGGINLYPQFDRDLNLLLEWLENDDGAMWDYSTNGEYIPDLITDCAWSKPSE